MQQGSASAGDTSGNSKRIVKWKSPNFLIRNAVGEKKKEEEEENKKKKKAYDSVK